jgi:hypothetical protein
MTENDDLFRSEFFIRLRGLLDFTGGKQGDKRKRGYALECRPASAL